MERTRLLVILLLVPVSLAGCLSEDGPPQPPPGDRAPVDQAGGTWTWTDLPEVPTPRTEVAAVVVDGMLVVLGGFEDNNAVSNKAEALDLETGKWSTLAPMPLPLHHAPAVVHDGQIHVMGGHAGIPFIPQRTHLIYDPGQDSWTMGTPLPAERGAHGIGLVGAKAYLVGGVDTQGLVTTVDVYDLANGTWSTAADLPTPREHLAATAMDGKVYVAGGREGGLDTNLATLEILTPGDGWATGPQMPAARGGIGGSVVEGLVVVVGGEANDGTFDEVEAYDPVKGAWTQLPGLPTARHGLGVIGHDGGLYVAAGGPEPGLTVSGAVEVLTMGPTG